MPATRLRSPRLPTPPCGHLLLRAATPTIQTRAFTPSRPSVPEAKDSRDGETRRKRHRHRALASVASRASEPLPEFRLGAWGYGRSAWEESWDLFRPWNSDHEVQASLVDATKWQNALGKTVLVVRGASPSIAASDFLRIGTQGRHLEGWNSLLRKVTPRLDPFTLEPFGQFFLDFDQLASAIAWRDDAMRRRRLSADLREEVFDLRRLRSATRSQIFTLAPAQAPLELLLLGRPPNEPGYRESLPSQLLDGPRMYRDARKMRVALRKQVGAGHIVLLKTEYCEITAEQLVELFTEMEAEVNYVTRIVDAVPLRYRLGRYRTNKGPDGCARFLLSFHEVEDALRFVRWWHKRTLTFPEAYTGLPKRRVISVTHII